MVDTFGHRLAGSKALESTIDWLLAQLSAEGFDNVHSEAAQVSQTQEFSSPGPK